MISGTTELIAHIGYPTTTFKSPGIYNPYFEATGIDAVVVPMACTADHYPALLNAIFNLENVRGALITMPHKVSTLALLDEMSPAVRVAGSCNAVRRDTGRLVGDMFDGEGFVRGLRRKGGPIEGARVLIVGAGGVGCAIAASLAGAGARGLTLFDTRRQSAEDLAGRIREHYPAVEVLTGSNDPEGFDVVVNATPLGMHGGDALPLDVDRLSPRTWVGDVVLGPEATPLVEAARRQGCPVLVGTDMLFEMIPAYLEFFGYPTTTPDHLRRLAGVSG